jgi:hypothetical protein
MYRRFSLKDLKGRRHMGDRGIDGYDIRVDLKEISFEYGNRFHLAQDGGPASGAIYKVGSLFSDCQLP